MDIKTKIKKILKILSVPIEFLVSMILAYSIYKFLIFKNYANIISAKHTIYILISSLIILYIIIYNIKNKVKIEKLAITFLIPVGMIYLMVIMPSQVPDENYHFYKTYEVSEGIFISSKDEATTVPSDLKNYLRHNINTYADFNSVISETTDYNDKIEVNNAFKTYPSFLYMFGAIGFVISRTFGLNILIGCILVKLINFIIFLVIAYFSIKIIPFGKYVITAIIFMPMFLHQATSASADCMLNNIAMLFISFTMYLLFKETKINKKEIALLVVLSLLLAVSKYVYLPIVGMVLLLIVSKCMSKKQKAIIIPIIIVISGLIAVGYFIFSSTYPNAHQAYLDSVGQNTTEQIKWILKNPIQYVNVFNNTLDNYGINYIFQMIGSSLGWLEISVNQVPILIYAILLVLSCFVEDNKVSFSTKQKIYLSLISIASIILVITSLYISWTGVGNSIIEGVQGRYFIPILFVILLCLCKKENYIKIKNVECKMLIAYTILNIAPICEIIKFYL